MLYKQSAIAVMVAIMLGLAPLFGGLSILPAFATHDSDAVEVAREQVTQADDEWVIIEAVEMDAKRVISRASGTVTVEIIQGSDVLERASFGTGALKTSFNTIEVDVTNVNVTGSFEILVEYEGSHDVMVNSIGIVEGTDVAEVPDDTTDPDPDPEPNAPEEPEVTENVIASKTIAQDEDETMTVGVVEFEARQSTSRSDGMLTVALVQDGGIIDMVKFDADSFKTSYTEREAAFDEEVTGDFDVVFMYEGDGTVRIAAINVPGTTTPAAEPPTDPEGTVTLIVEAVDQNNAKIEGLWVALLNGNNGLSAIGFTEINSTFTLEADKTYMVEMGDFFDEESGTAYNFEGWQDSTNDNTRRSANPADFENNQDTFTALYTVTTGSGPPPADDPSDPTDPTDPSDPPTDPGSSAPGTVTIFAHRIASPHWGSTFTGANAQMYFVVYNSTGWIIYSGFFDENGHVINGLNEGETYWLSPTDCDECHGDPHNVEFRHWHDGSTEVQRPVTTGDSAHAYYEFVPPS